MEIYLIRHGETMWNTFRRLQGRTDIELNENGRMLAYKTSEKLKDLKFDRIYSSPLKRAYETANIIKADRDIPIITDDRIMEMSFGTNEGCLSEEILADETNPFRYFFEKPERYFAPDQGETFEDVIERGTSFMKEVIEPIADDNERIMIVAHGAINKAIMCYVKQHGKDRFWEGDLQKNCGVIIFDYNSDNEGNGYSMINEGTVFWD
ncbi:MAG: histidine phosphatase family protein [Lachnospiraceae bacterium]|nr:histidine phosphatase family protein [Lachnospiraceae bacterium]